MKLGILFSGEKDSVYATYIANQFQEIAYLISIHSLNENSFMFHTPSIKKTKKQSETIQIPLIIQKTKGKKEDELKDLRKRIKNPCRVSNI